MEINDLFRTLKNYKSRVLGIFLAFLIFGVVAVLVTPKTYRAEALLLPEPKGNSSLGASGLSSLASSIPGFSGLNIPTSGSEAIRPEFYPSIIQSTPFILAFKSHTFYHLDFEEDLSILSYGEKYAPFDIWSFAKKYTVGLPGLILEVFRGPSNEIISNNIIGAKQARFYRPSASEFKLLKTLKEIVNVAVDKKTGIIQINVETTNPVLSAELTEFTKNYLVDFVQKYRSEKLQQIVTFLLEKQTELEKTFLSDQAMLAAFKEQNFNISSPYLLNRQENLMAQYELSKSMYFSLSSQLQQAKVKLNEVTPIFLEIEPVMIPPLKNKPQTLLIIFLMGSQGVLVAAIYVLIKTPSKG
jgi:uncharacterized protein involved in exopolysaccharide biosynthesis